MSQNMDQTQPTALSDPRVGQQAPLPRGPAFDLPLPAGGYAWWYLDGVSDDGRSAVTAIAFVGSVFSPWYFRARQRGPASPLQFAAINLSIRTPQGPLWVMNERAITPADRQRQHLQLGPGTALTWHGDHLQLQFDEQTKPFFQRMPPRLRGSLRLTPLVSHGTTATLDAAGRHRWCCVAPHARFELHLSEPGLRFAGHGYHDANWGDEGLERGFAGWHWSRARLADATAVVYDTSDLSGQRRPIQRLFHCDGRTTELDPQPRVALPSGAWGVQRATCSDDGRAELQTTLEDSPFYVRSLVQGRWQGQRATAVHESLDLRRFSAPWVRFLLPWRSRRDVAPLPASPALALETR